MGRYRKKPVVIEAHQLTSANGDQIALWCGGQTMDEASDGSCTVHITTLEGVMVASPGDFVIQGVSGEFYPCKPDIFDATYEPAE